MAVLVTFRQKHCNAERASARDDRYFMQRFVTFGVQHAQRMAGFVIGGQLFFVLGHHHRAPLGAHHDLVLGLLELAHRDRTFAAASGHQRGFVDEVGEIGTGEAGRAARDDLGIDIRRQRHLAHVHFKDLLATDHIRVGHDDLAVEAAGPQQRRVEHIRPVGGGDQDHSLVRLETIHLDQQLVQRLFALVIAAAQPGAAVAANGVDFVDEDDAGRILLCPARTCRARGWRRRRQTSRQSRSRRS